MNPFRLPPDTRIVSAHLRVSHLKDALAFYKDLLGFQQIDRQSDTVSLSANGALPEQLVLTEHPGARPKPRQTTGLFHVAIRLPNRLELARVINRLRQHNWPIEGASDHGVSDALYLSDPDSNGLELYFDRPRDQWPLDENGLAMFTRRFNVDDLIAEAQNHPVPWTGIHPNTDIGHVHLQVSNLEQTEAFYNGLMGFDVTQRTFQGALFMSAGGYHHHLGLNTWDSENGSPPPGDAVGLISFALTVPEEARQPLLDQFENAEIQPEEINQGLLFQDPDQNNLEIRFTT
ncbi:MAG: VOC family protein [bacterium]|nr:VOC family protein [bacterium]